LKAFIQLKIASVIFMENNKLIKRKWYIDKLSIDW